MSLADLALVVVCCLAAPVVAVLVIVYAVRGWRDERQIRAAERRVSPRESSKLGAMWERHQSERLGFSSRTR